MEETTTNYKTFTYLEDGTISFSILSTKFLSPTLIKGVYDLKTIYDHRGYTTSLVQSNIAENFNEEISQNYKERLDSIFNTFFNLENKELINKLGYNHKTGILLYGKAGTGKTSILKSYFEKAIKEQDSIVFNITDLNYFNYNWDFIKKIRKIQNNPIVVFMDEFEDVFEKYKSEDIVKRAMDGFDSIDNCFFMLTTNYIDKIPKTIKDRPSRIKYCIELEGIQEEKLIEKFLKSSFEKINKEYDFYEDIKQLKGSTTDDLKQYVIDKILNIENVKNKTKTTVGFKK